MRRPNIGQALVGLAREPPGGIYMYVYVCVNWLLASLCVDANAEAAQADQLMRASSAFCTLLLSYLLNCRVYMYLTCLLSAMPSETFFTLILLLFFLSFCA